MLDILLVDDDAMVRESIADALVDAGHAVTQASDGEQAASLSRAHTFDVAVCDVNMPKMDGLTLFRRLRRDSPGTAVVIMTSFGRIPDVIGTLRDGAVDYVTKPFDPTEFTKKVIGSIDERTSLRRTFERARSQSTTRRTGSPLVGDSGVMRRLADRIKTLADVETPVLLTGASGTGKELAARTLHAGGARRDGPFVVIPCASLPDLMVEAELRELAELRPGHQRDAWFRSAEGGTLVLQEVGELAPIAQTSLLRILREPQLRARRSRQWQPLGVRVVATTTQELSERVAAGTFQDGLYYQLNGVGVRVPSLRERDGDLVLLVEHFLRELTVPGVTPPAISPATWQELQRRTFVGNVRELRWTLEHALSLTSGAEIALEHLPEPWSAAYV
jgi:DNA-binding NtrC family response regulator